MRSSEPVSTAISRVGEPVALALCGRPRRPYPPGRIRAGPPARRTMSAMRLQKNMSIAVRSCSSSALMPRRRASATKKMRSAVGRESAASRVPHRSTQSPPPSRRLQAGAARLQGTQGLAEGLLESAADGHDLAHGLHTGRERVIGALELLEGEARGLHHAVVDGRLEAGRRGAASCRSRSRPSV